MNNSFSILHLSDLHFDHKKSENSQLIVDSIFGDIEKLKVKENLDIKLILFTGDLVNFGGQAELFEGAYNEVIKPLLDRLGLEDKDFIYIPGNHELDRSKVDSDFQSGFISRVLNADIDKEDLSKETIVLRSQNFYNFINKFYGWDSKEVIKNIVLEVNNTTIGISLYNTAWSSSTYSDQDAKKIIMPPLLAKRKLQELDSCDFKIAMMHHPIDWFDDENSNKIQHVLSQYNLVLCGHKHQENSKMEQKGPLKTVYNYAHKLFPFDDKESGYSIIKVLPNENMLHIYFREYSNKLNGFATGITNVEQDDKSLKYSEYEIGKSDPVLQSCYKVFSGIKNNFIKSLDDLFVTNTLEGNKKTFDDLFVNFSLSDHPIYSDPSKEKLKNDANKFYYINDLANLEGVVNIYGKKESGKTVLSYSLAKHFFDNFESYKKIPVVLNCKKYGSLNTNISKAITEILFEYVDENGEVTKKDISLLIENSMIVLICDEPEFLSQKQNKEIATLQIKKYFINNDNPLVFGEDDKAYIENEISDEKKNFFIKPYNKNDVRKLINNISVTTNDNQYVENVITYFYTTSLPRNPFVVSLIATICSKHRDTIPTNQAKILEQFLENVLEKINPIEQLSKTYDFSNKEDFLSRFAYELYQSNSFSMSVNDFYQFTLDYHKEKGFSLEDSKFDSLFFEKNILVKDGNIVYFRFACFNYYYLAKYSIKNAEFRDRVIGEDKIIENADMLFYYTGLKRDDAKLLEFVSQQLDTAISKYPHNTDIFNGDPIKTNLGLTDEFVEAIRNKPITINQEEKDKVTDRGDTSLEYNPKNPFVGEKGHSLDKLLSVAGFCVKNCEELSAVQKKKAMEIYLKGCYVLWNDFRIKMLQFAKEINNKIKQSNGNIDEQIQKAYDLFEDILKTSIPVAISQLVSENTATEKMKNIYEELFEESQDNSPEKLFLTFLLLDLNYKKSAVILNSFIKDTDDKNYLKVCLVKLLYSFFYGNLSGNTKLIELFADCYIKATNAHKNAKGKIIESVKKKEFYNKFLIDDSSDAKNSKK